MEEAEGSIIERFKIFSGKAGGIDSWLSDGTSGSILGRLTTLEAEPLTKAGLSQLLTLAHEAPISQAMFNYYWLEAIETHPYDVTEVEGFQPI
jgi:hypothetical protein